MHDYSYVDRSDVPISMFVDGIDQKETIAEKISNFFESIKNLFNRGSNKY